MTRTYHLNNYQGSRTSRISLRGKIAFGLAGIFFILALLWNLSASVVETRGFERAATQAATPLLKLRASVLAPFAGLRTLLTEKQTLAARNEKLTRELAAAQNQLRRLELVEKNYADLERQVSGGELSAEKRVAKILTDLSLSTDDIILTSVAGGKVGDLALLDESVLIGQVIGNTTHTARVRLYSSPGVTAHAQVGEESETIRIEGRGGGNMYARVPRGFKVEPKDSVRVLVNTKTYLLGIVGEIDSTESDPFQELYITLPKPLSIGDYLTILSQNHEISP